ncbi:SAP domain-containing protein [Methanobrevibacter sp.]|uniref:SAP domain-containing protein n=1 Tax=Methanobrevibacter sp. TaxID=66852 RepID=UPI00388D72B5
MFDNSHSFEKFSLEYPNKVPEDYNISKMQFTFDFIYRVLKLDESIDDAVKIVSDDYGLSEEYLMDYMLEERYILNKMNKNEFSNQIKRYNTKSLKKILKKHGLKTSGKREKIEKRIIDNKLIGNSYYLSSKSKIFYKNKKRRIKIFNKYLSSYYYFREFNEFYMDNYRKKEANIPIEFINLHINKAVEEKSHRRYIYNNHFMTEHFYKKGNYRKMLEYALKNYCMNINPIWKIDKLNEHFGLSRETYDHLTFLEEQISRNSIINMYYWIWDSFDFDKIIVSKYDGYRYLKDILNLKEYSKIIHDLNNRFYSNEELKIKKITQKTLFDY